MDIKQLGKKAARYVGDLLLRKLLIAIAPYVLIFVGIFILGAIAFHTIFEMPKEALTGITTDPLQAFFYGTKEEQEDVFPKYQEVAAKWNEGLNAFQLAQVDPYSLPYGWLAIVDRTLQDPFFIETYDYDPEQVQKELVLKPDQTFEEVKPVFTWENRQQKTVQQVCVRKSGGTNANGKKSYVIQTTTTIVTKELLMKARTMQNEYVYSYVPTVSSSKKSSKCGTLTSTVYWFAVSDVQTTLEDWQPLRELLVQHHVSEKDQDFLMDYWLEYLIDDDVEGGFLPDDSWTPSGGSLTWPVPSSHRITSSFGVRVHPVTGETKMHNGIDIGIPEGTPVNAAAAGTVVYAAPMGTAGNAIIIKHDGGVETRYYHLLKINVQSGQTVEAGQQIALSGTTGRSTGPHLHFEVRVNGNPVDPISYFGGGGSDPLKYRPLNIAAVQLWLQSRNSALANASTLRMIDAAGKATNVDPHLLIAITGAEQSFVPASHPQASQIIRNPWNVFGFWSKGKGATLTTGESARIAAKTIVKLSKGRPANVNPIQWLSSRDNPSGYYAGDGDNWFKNVSIFYDQLSQLR